jgi:8-oxo-dGTP diphosphatase
MKSKPWGLVVRALIRDENGWLLLLRRSTACRRFAGAWEFPGGRVHPGEAIAAAMLRETRDETGIDVRPLSMSGAVEAQIPKMHLVMMFFEVTPIASTSVVLSPEHDGYAWTKPDGIAALHLTPHVREFLKEHPFS